MGQYYRQGAGGTAKGREWGTGGAATIAPIVIALMKFHAIYAIRCRRPRRRRRRRRRRWSRCWSSSLKEFCANFLRQSHDKALQQQQRMRVPLAKADRSEVEGGRATRREERVVMGCYLWGHWCTSFQSITISTFFRRRRRFSLWRILFFQLTVYWLRSTCRRYNVSKLLKCFVRNFKQFFGGCDAVHRIKLQLREV